MNKKIYPFIQLKYSQLVDLIAVTYEPKNLKFVVALKINFLQLEKRKFYFPILS